MNKGSETKNPRNKHVAVLAALFAGPLVWLYTFKRDKLKFFIGLSVVIGTLLIFAANLVYLIYVYPEVLEVEFSIWYYSSTADSANFFLLSMFAAWLWALVDSLLKPSWWYENYPVKLNPLSTTRDFIRIFSSQDSRPAGLDELLSDK